MEYIYAVALTGFAVMMMVFRGIMSRKYSDPLAKSVEKLMQWAVITSLTYSAAIICSSEFFSVLFYGVYYASCDVLAIVMLHYVVRFSSSEMKCIMLKPVILFVTIADALLLVLNVFFHNVFLCSPVDMAGGSVVYCISSRLPLFIVHELQIGLIISFTFVTLIYNIFNSPAVYRKKYGIVCILYLLVVLMNQISYLMDIKVDLSVAAYGILAGSIYYYSVIYVPHDLVEQLLASAVRTMDDGVMCYDAFGNCIYVNQIVVASVGAEKIEKSKKDFFENSMKLFPDIRKDVSWKKKYGEDTDIPKHLEITRKALTDSKDSYLGCYFVFHDETEDIIKFEHERYRITHDRLTDLYNREHFYEKVRELLQTAENNEYCILCSDIKDFKLVNDVFGVEKGDQLLKNIAQKLRNMNEDTSKEKIIYGRMSGDRFAMCISRERYDEESFISEIQKLGEVSENKAYHVYIHLGVFLINDTSLEVSVMCDRAFMAINSIKDSYTEVVAHYDEKLRESRIHEKEITSQFNDAIRSGQFRMFLQPQINTSGEMIGAEALVRWFHPDQGVIPPLDFIGIFEKSGLIGTLDHHIWELACLQLKKWKDEGREQYHISVNISPRDFYFMNIYEIFTGLVEKYDINPVNLKLEITETAIMTDAKNQLALMDRLREYGFHVEIDDFGSGYSSLSMLKEINADVLKVDMGFLEKTDNLEKSRAILSSIISLSKQLGMDVVTEGVETKEQVEFLSEAGCDVFQGYYFDRPMQVEDFEKKYFS